MTTIENKRKLHCMQNTR